MALNKSDDKNYLSVLADGKLHLTVPEGTEGAVKRSYETSDGKTGEKWEFVFKDVSGMITKVGFYEGDYGKQLQLTIEDGDEKPVVLSLSTSQNYGEDMMKKLLNIDLSKPVKLAPYSFTDDKGKLRKGISVIQEEVKIKNYFYDEAKGKNINGYPEPKMPKGKKTLSKDEWKLYFMQARMFLIEKITEHFKIEESHPGSNLEKLTAEDNGDM